MAKNTEKALDVAVTYQLDAEGRALRKLGAYNDKTININLGTANQIAFGPDIEDFATLPNSSLVSYRVDQVAALWRQHGLRNRIVCA